MSGGKWAHRNPNRRNESSCSILCRVHDLSATTLTDHGFLYIVFIFFSNKKMFVLVVKYLLFSITQHTANGGTHESYKRFYEPESGSN